MRIGFCSVYAWRPHVEHMHYLAGLLRQDHHDVSFLTCDGDFDTCYTKELRPARLNVVHCLMCRAGGLRSYEKRNVCSMGGLSHETGSSLISKAEWSRSSASTLGRFESDNDFASEHFLQLASRLQPTTSRAFSAALHWIEREDLEAVFVFNGRMDATRAVFEAARYSGIPVVSVERTWFGDGLQLLPDENCLGLRSIDQMMINWRDKPLTRDQAFKAAKHIAERFLRQNTNEWRAYNLSAVKVDWPIRRSNFRVLLVPGSRNEIFGHPDWVSHWPEHTAAFDAIMKQFDLSPDDVVLRCHPNWGEKIGTVDGSKAEHYYSEWARLRGVLCISSTDPTSTLDLIEDSDAVVVCGGSAALEAGILGKQVFSISPSVYRNAGFDTDASSLPHLQKQSFNAALDRPQREMLAEQITRKTLRFAYTMIYRAPQFVEFVRCKTTTSYEYFEGANPQRIIDLLRTRVLQSDDHAFANDVDEEDSVLDVISKRDWRAIVGSAPELVNRQKRKVRRRLMFRYLDSIRDAMPRGDL